MGALTWLLVVDGVVTLGMGWLLWYFGLAESLVDADEVRWYHVVLLAVLWPLTVVWAIYLLRGE